VGAGLNCPHLTRRAKCRGADEDEGVVCSPGNRVNTGKINLVELRLREVGDCITTGYWRLSGEVEVESICADRAGKHVGASTTHQDVIARRTSERVVAS